MIYPLKIESVVDMNEEKKEQLLIILKLIIIAICATLYAWGGMEMKWLRRFLAPAILGATCFGFTRDWKSLIKMPVFILASCLGYGADVLWVKIIKRSYVGLTFGAGSASYEFLRKNWILGAFALVLCVSVFVVFGVFNPFNSARIEETFLGLLTYAMAIMPLQKRSESWKE